jgi:hypothetical protein
VTTRSPDNERSAPAPFVQPVLSEAGARVPTTDPALDMISRRTSLLIALIVGAVVGVGYPFVDLALACRLPQSEACVWGKAYFPVTLILSVVMAGTAAAGLTYAVLAWRRRRRGRHNTL